MEPTVNDLATLKSRLQTSPSPVTSLPATDSRLEGAILHALLEQLPVGVVIANGTGPNLRVYENELAQRVRSSDTAKAEWVMARALLLGEVIREEEVEIVMSDRTRRVFSVSATPIQTLPGRTEGAVVTFADVTALKQAAAWRPVIESLQRL